MTLSLLDWVEIKIISENNNKLIGEFIQKLDNDIDKLIEKKFKLTKIEDIQLNNIENNGFIESYRKDLRYMNTFTIDPPNSLDCDDAFSIEHKDDNIHIYVHISDTAHYINPCLANFEEIINSSKIEK
jgi:exoribonuclease R